VQLKKTQAHQNLRHTSSGSDWKKFRGPVPCRSKVPAKRQQKVKLL